MKEINSVLKFLSYKVDEIKFKRNKNFIEKENGTSIKLSINPKIETEKEKMNITLSVEIFKDAEKNNYPFEMVVELTGFFEAENEKPEKFIANAIAILYPYIRAIVSTYTANANISPLILSAINVNQLIENQKKEKKI